MAKTDTPGTELVAAPTQALVADDRPDFIEFGDRSGTEHIGKDDLQIPRLALAQLSSPELIEDDAKYIPGLKFGDLFNTLSQEVYGVGPLKFSVVRADPPRYVEFHPLEQGGGIKDPNVHPDDLRTKFGPNGEKPVATKFYDFVVMLHGPKREFVALSFKSTGLKVAKILNGLIFDRKSPLYAGVYQLMTSTAKNTKGRYAVYQVKNAGWPDAETYAFVKEAASVWADKEIIIDREHDADSFNTAEFDAQ